MCLTYISRTLSTIGVTLNYRSNLCIAYCGYSAHSFNVNFINWIVLYPELEQTLIFLYLITTNWGLVDVYASYSGIQQYL
jgi:hypothetical protein